MMAAVARRGGALRALGHGPFAMLWVGQTLSRVGDFVYELALAWWVLRKTGSAELMGLVLVCAIAPMLVFLLIGGVLGDRLPRVRVMFASDLGRGVIAGVVAGLAATDQLVIGQVFLAAFLFGVVDAFFQPAYSAVVPQLTPASLLPSANALNGMSANAGRVVGPGVGAALVALGGTPLAFALNSLSFFVAAVLLLPLLRRPAPVEQALASDSARASADAVGHEVAEPRPSGILREVTAGWRTVASTPILLLPILMFAFTNITLAGPYSVALPFLVSDHLHADVETLGFLYTIFPLGYIAGGLWAGRWGRVRRRGLLIVGGEVVAGAMLALFGVTTWLPLLVGAAFVNGAALEIGTLAWTGTFQEQTPAEQLGRVASIELLGSFSLLPVGFALAGVLTAAWGAAPVFLAGGLATVALAGAAALVPALRRFD